jgi:hypothetical protein
MITMVGNGDMENSEQIAHYGLHMMIPALEGTKAEYIAAKNLRSPSFVRHPDYLAVTRDPEDTLVHDHGRHVLLMRSGDHVPDDTLICDYNVGARALARAGIHTDIVRKIQQQLPIDNPDTADILDELANGFSLIAAAIQNNVPVLLRNGQECLRRSLPHAAKVISGEVKHELYKTLVCGHHEIPPQSRSSIQWDAEGLDALVIGANTGHARSLLNVDSNTATREELEAALGGVGQSTERGLHFASFVPNQ